MTPQPRLLLRWIASFAGFPLGGWLVVSLFPVDGPGSFLAGGLVGGTVLGAAQWLAGRPLGIPLPWLPGTALGMGLGSGAAALFTGTGTGLAHLVLLGAVAGGTVGLGQGLTVSRDPRRVLPWAAVVSAAWALGWLVTTSIGVDVERGYLVFGASGALAASVVTGLALPILLRPAPSAASVAPAPARAAA